MFFFNCFIAIIGFAISDEAPSKSATSLGFITKFFVYQYGIFKRGFEYCFNRFLTDIICLLLHCALLCGLNLAVNLHLVFQFMCLEVVFYFSEFTMRIFPFSISYNQDLLKMISVYLLESFLISTRLFTEDISLSLYITIAVHAFLLILLVFRKIQKRKSVTLFTNAESCLLINLKEDLNASVDSNNENTTQHYLIKYKNKIQLVAIGQPKLSSHENLSQKESANQKEKEEGQKYPPQQTFSEMIQNHPMNIMNPQNTDDKQILQETREKQSTISKFTGNKYYNSEDAQTTRKKSNNAVDSPHYTTHQASSTQISNHLMLIGGGGTISDVNTYNNIQNSQTVLQSNHKNTTEHSKKNENKNSNQDSSPKRRTRFLSLDAENLNIDIINTLELDPKEYNQFELVSFHEESQQLLVKTDSAASLFHVPDFKKTKSILLDNKSRYIFHSSQPTCMQYHYCTTNNQYQFVKLNLNQAQITKEDMKYNSIVMQNPKYLTNDLLYYGTFCPDLTSSSKDILFISDGPDLITINTDGFSMESYNSKLPIESNEKVQISQLNNRQVVVNAPNQTQLQKFVLDIPTNICCRQFTNLPISTEMIQIENLQNQIILNNQKISKSPCVYDMNTGEIMELRGASRIQKAWSVNKCLYTIDETKSIKVYSFSRTKYILTPPGDNGVGCVSIAFF